MVPSRLVVLLLTVVIGGHAELPTPLPAVCTLDTRLGCYTDAFSPVSLSRGMTRDLAAQLASILSLAYYA
jgi:hypothetical protein